MLVAAYSAAFNSSGSGGGGGSFALLDRLFTLLTRPYEEHSPEDEAAFFTRDFDEEAKAGVAFMT